MERNHLRSLLKKVCCSESFLSLYQIIPHDFCIGHMPWFLLLLWRHVNAIFSCLSFCRSSMSARHGNTSTLRTFAWLKAVSASPRGFFPRAGNLRGMTRTFLRNGDAFLSPRPTGEAWPACDAGLSVYIAASHTSFSACVQNNRGRAQRGLVDVLETCFDGVGTDLTSESFSYSWGHVSG